MLTSTLPNLEGKRYEVKEVVFASVTLGAHRGGSLEIVFQAIEQQAVSTGADAIIDIKVATPGGERGIAVVTGTAVRIIM